MSEKTLSAKLRKDDFGSAGARRLVRAGLIPAVVYGKEAPIHVILNAKEFAMKKNSFSESTLIALDVDGENHRVFVKSFQEDFLKDIVKHVDFFEVTAGVSVKTHVRVELEGTPEGCKIGGVLEQIIHEVEIECFPRHLPSVIKASVDALNVNESIRVSDLVVGEEVKVLTEANQTVATVKALKAEESSATDAE